MAVVVRVTKVAVIGALQDRESYDNLHLNTAKAIEWKAKRSVVVRCQLLEL